MMALRQEYQSITDFKNTVWYRNPLKGGGFLQSKKSEGGKKADAPL